MLSRIVRRDVTDPRALPHTIHSSSCHLFYKTSTIKLSLSLSNAQGKYNTAADLFLHSTTKTKSKRAPKASGAKRSAKDIRAEAAARRIEQLSIFTVSVVFTGGLSYGRTFVVSQDRLSASSIRGCRGI